MQQLGGLWSAWTGCEGFGLKNVVSEVALLSKTHWHPVGMLNKAWMSDIGMMKWGALHMFGWQDL